MPDLLLLGCVATKSRYSAPAKDMYTSQLWMSRRRYAESRAIPWRIFSAKHGLLLPDQVIDPYDTRITSLCMQDRAELAARVAQAIAREEPRAVELHCGEDYCDPLALMLARRGIEVQRPLEGLGIGEQLAWYAARLEEYRQVGAGQLELFGRG